MQVFIVGSPLETAQALDYRRLSKQIIECQQIVDALNGKQAWHNHPCTLQYKNNIQWLLMYKGVLTTYRDKMFEQAEILNNHALKITPTWHNQAYYDQMKRRLFTKNPEHYSQWKNLGMSDINCYCVDGVWKYYKNGKLLKQ